MNIKVCVVGLGYVGLPLALAFAKHFPTIGYDVVEQRIAQLKQGIDKSREISSEELRSTTMLFTDDPATIAQANFIIVTVPTPLDDDEQPDLTFLEKASETISKHIQDDSIVVYESTVYPGVTEEVCLPILQKSGRSFKVGYSPERINPGDKQKTVENILKIVSGQDTATTEKIAEVYGKVVKAGLFKAKDIKTAEAAKVIENIQRNVNIALMNELALIFHKMDINTRDVIEAAATKWNFHKYYPGLVGGHCIGVDPYYLTYKAMKMKFRPSVILAGRETNEFMAKHVANLTAEGLNQAGKVLKGSTVYMLGLTFKENVADARNSKAKEVIEHLQQFGIKVVGYEPMLDAGAVLAGFGIENKAPDQVEKCDAVVLINAHEAFKPITIDTLKAKMDTPVLVDIKSFFSQKEAEEKQFLYFTL